MHATERHTARTVSHITIGITRSRGNVAKRSEPARALRRAFIPLLNRALEHRLVPRDVKGLMVIRRLLAIPAGRLRERTIVTRLYRSVP